VKSTRRFAFALGLVADGRIRRVRAHDFVLPGLGHAIPYGVYDLVANTGGGVWAWITIEQRFGWRVSICWWKWMGSPNVPACPPVAPSRPMPAAATAPASAGGRWSFRSWRTNCGLPISVCHFPPGTSKWNKIGHRLFFFISQNWRGKAPHHA